jgi:serine/threonine protein kinase
LINTVLFSEKKKCVMEKYETLKKLGIGGCGAVYLVKDKETKK